MFVKYKGKGSRVWSMDKFENKLFDMRDVYQERKEKGLPLQVSVDDFLMLHMMFAIYVCNNTGLHIYSSSHSTGVLFGRVIMEVKPRVKYVVAEIFYLLSFPVVLVCNDQESMRLSQCCSCDVFLEVLLCSSNFLVLLGLVQAFDFS